MSIINNRDALSFLNLNAPQKEVSVSKDSTIENQINKGMKKVIHEYLVKEWGEYYKHIQTDKFGVDTKKTNGDVKETTNDVPTRVDEYYIVLPTNNGTSVKGKKVGRCFRLGTAQTYLQGIKTTACCYYTESGKTYYYDKNGKVVTK